MKTVLLIVGVLVVALAGCVNKQSATHEMTATELDSIRHKQINDSINQLDTIRLLGSLFMGMNIGSYDALKEESTLPINIGQLSFEKIDTSMYHNTVHNIILKAQRNNYASTMDNMAKYAIWGENTFYDVIKALSSKYGSPSWVSRMSKISDNGEQFGISQWDFDRFSINYEQRQHANLRNNEHTIDAKITYSIPRIETPEEKQKTDSIVNAWKRRQEAEEQRNNKAIQSL